MQLKYIICLGTSTFKFDREITIQLRVQLLEPQLYVLYQDLGVVKQIQMIAGTIARGLKMWIKMCLQRASTSSSLGVLQSRRKAYLAPLDLHRFLCQNILFTATKRFHCYFQQVYLQTSAAWIEVLSYVLSLAIHVHCQLLYYHEEVNSDTAFVI